MASNAQPRLIMILSFSLFIINPTKSAGVRDGLTSSWQPITDLSDAAVKKIAKFAVDKHNSKAKTSLKFAKFISGETLQLDNGKKYQLTIVVEDHRVPIYIAVVYDQPEKHIRKLISFNAIYD